MFYEDGIYRAHLLSIIQDFDLNIINQLPQRMAWIVTPSYFFPTGHSEIQVSGLYILNLIERLSTRIYASTLPSVFLSSILMNFFSIWITHVLLSKIVKVLGITVGKFDYIFLIIASPLFYFSFLTTTVLDVTILPLITFLILFSVSPKKSNTLAAVLAMGMLTITKHYAIVVVVAFSPIIIKEIRKKSVTQQLAHLGLYLALPIAALTNYFLKFGLTTSIESGTYALIDFSMGHIAEKIIYGYFGDRGLFTLQPILLFGFVSCLMYLWHLHRKNKISSLLVLLIGLWLVTGVGSLFFFRGDFYEDHIPGRSALLIYPLVFIGILWVKNFYLLKYKKIFQTLAIALIIYNILITFGFNFVEASGGHYAYANQLLPKSVDSLVPYLNIISWNFSLFKQSFGCVIVFVSITTVLHAITCKKFNMRKIFWSLTICSATYITFTIMNFHFSDKNTQNLKGDNFFSDKVIGKGPEIYIFDYILDRVQVILHREGSRKKDEVNKFMDPYFKAVEKQIIQSQPWLDECIRQRNISCTFFHKNN